MYRFLLIFISIFSVSFDYITTISINNRNDNINEEEKIKALENNSLIEGDIIPNLNTILNETLSGNKSSLYHTMMFKSLKWPNGIINFKLDRRFYDDEVNLIIESMYRIERRSCIRFRPHKPIYGLDYVKIIKGSGCYSSAGRVGGAQILSLGKGCLNIGTIQHELLHSIGFFHTHMRMDRDKFLNIHYNNIKDEYKAQFNKLSKRLVRLLTPFDYQSIMIYGSKAFSKNDRPTMTPKANVKLTYPFDKKKMSRNDVIAINRLYKCSSRARKRSSLIFFSNPSDESEDSEVDYPKLDDILIGETDEDDLDDKIESNFDLELEKMKLEKKKLLKENLEKEKLEEERLKKEKIDKQMEQEKLKKQKLEKERERLEREKQIKIAKEKLDKEKQIKLDKERIEMIKLEKMKMEKNKLKLNQAKPQIKRESSKEKVKEKLMNEQANMNNKKVVLKFNENQLKEINKSNQRENKSNQSKDLNEKSKLIDNLNAHNRTENLKESKNYKSNNQQIQLILESSDLINDNEN